MANPFDGLTDDELCKALKNAILRVRERCDGVFILFDWTEITIVVAHLQLALAHPDNRGNSSTVVKELVASIIRRIAQEDQSLAQLLALGSDPRRRQGG